MLQTSFHPSCAVATEHSSCSLRFRFYFLADVKVFPLGIADRRIANGLMKASSYYNFYCGPWNARLNQRRAGRNGGAWCAKRRDKAQWLQIDFGALTRVLKIATQGRQNSDQWVTSYYVSYSKNRFGFVTYKERRRTKVGFTQ